MLKGRVKTNYVKLVSEFPLVEIGSEEHLKAAEHMLESLLDCDKLSVAQEKYLNVLAMLIERYEAEHYPIGEASDADLLRLFLEDRELTQSRLADEAGISKSTISQILSGDRPFSKGVINKLADYFGVDKSIFAQNV